jgi:S1-C subfamily serine protease
VVNAAKNGQDFFERPFIGAAFEPVTPQIAESLGMKLPTGALIANVAEGGPAEKAGLKPGDVILAMNEIAIEHVDALGYRLATATIGAKANLKVLTKGEEKTVEIVLSRAPEGAVTDPVLIDGRSPFAGAKVIELSPRLAQRLGLPSDKTGVTVVDISRDSPAAGLGLRPRDIVREVNGREITTAAQLSEAASQKTRWWRFTVERDGRTMKQMLRF